MKDLSLVVFCLVIAQCFAKECSEAPDVTGCSIPNWVPYKKKFSPACYKHDVCYTCGSALDVSRVQCDRQFRVNLRALCSGWWCKRAADLYYSAVRWFAGNFYAKSSPWCTEKWVANCMT